MHNKLTQSDVDAEAAAVQVKAAPATTPPALAQSTLVAAAKNPAVQDVVELKAGRLSLQSNDGASSQSLPPGFIDSLRGAAGLASDVSSLKQVLGGAAALSAHAKVSQQQIDDTRIIRCRPELQLFYGAVCQGLQSMLHIAAAFKTGAVQLDRSSSFSSKLGLVSDHYEDAVGAVSKAASRARELASCAGNLESAANVVVGILDAVKEIADGIPVASFVLKGLSFVVNHVEGLKFDARMNRVIESLFPELNPLAWTYVVEEVARRVAVLCAPEIQALHSGTEENRGLVMNWFRSKCSDYGLATLTTKAEDAVVMMAMLKVDCVSQFALSGSVPEGLSEVELADLIVRHIVSSAPVPAPAQASAVPSVQLSAVSTGRSSPPPHDIASHGELEELRKKVEEQNKEMKLFWTKLEKLAPQDDDCDETGSGEELVLASRKSKVDAESMSAAAGAQGQRSVQQQVVRVEQRVDELATFIVSHIAAPTGHQQSSDHDRHVLLDRENFS
jgi:hypothetical protein